MPPKRKKQQPKNALYHFANIEVRRHLKEEGRPSVSIQELIKIAHPRFQLLSEDEQNRWKEFAKQDRLKLRADTENIFTSYGESVADIDRMRESEAKFNKMMKDDINLTVQNLQRENTLLQEKFYILDFNIFVKIPDPDQYIPAEICVSELTLEKGIESVFQTVIIQRTIPMGYMAEARETSQSTHRIPIRYAAEEPNYASIIYRLKNFINPNEEKVEYPPFYVMPENMEKCLSVLQWMYECCSDKRRFPFKVYDLSYLLYILRYHNPLDMAPGFPSTCEDLLHKPHFDYVPNLECNWHRDLAEVEEDVETMYCIQSKVTSKAYLFLDGCIGFYGIEPVANKHCPEAFKSTMYNIVPARHDEQQPVNRFENSVSSHPSEDRETTSSRVFQAKSGSSLPRTRNTLETYSCNESWGNSSPFSNERLSVTRTSRNCEGFQKESTSIGRVPRRNIPYNGFSGSRSYASSEHGSISGDSSKYYTASEHDSGSVSSSVYYTPSSQLETQLPYSQHWSEQDADGHLSDLASSNFANLKEDGKSEKVSKTHQEPFSNCDDKTDDCISAGRAKENGLSREVNASLAKKEERVPKSKSMLQQMYERSFQNQQSTRSDLSSRPKPTRRGLSVSSFIEKSVKENAIPPPPGFENICPTVRLEQQPKPVFVPPVGVKPVQPPMYSVGRGRGLRKPSNDLQEEAQLLERMQLGGIGRGRSRQTPWF